MAFRTITDGEKEKATKSLIIKKKKGEKVYCVFHSDRGGNTQEIEVPRLETRMETACNRMKYASLRGIVCERSLCCNIVRFQALHEAQSGSAQ